MNSSQKKKSPVTVVVNNAAPKSTPNGGKKSMRKKAGKSRGKQMPAWFNLVMNPFEHQSVCIPDEDTRQSFKFSSRRTFTVRTGFTGATTGTDPAAVCAFFLHPYIESPTDIDANAAIYYGDANGVINPNDTASVAPISTEVPNRQAILPALTDGTSTGITTQLVRPTAFALRVTPLVPELSRGGEIDTGFIGGPKISTLAAGKINPLNVCLNGDTSVARTSLRQRLQRYAVTRTPDGTVELRWIPKRVPKYFNVIRTGVLDTLMDFLDAELQVPVVRIVDSLPVAAAQGFEYRFELIYHWEIATTAVEQMSSMPTPSSYDVFALQKCINGFQEVHSQIVQRDNSMFMPNFGENDVTHGVPSAWESAGQTVSRAGNIVSEGVSATMASPSFQEAVAQTMVAGALGLAGAKVAHMRLGR